MQLQLNNIYPRFFNGQQGKRSDIWQQALVLEQGEPVHIIAPSGSGKTSLMHFLYGLNNDYSGTIQYNKQPINSIDATQMGVWRQQHISIVFQDLRLFPEQTVLQNLQVKRALAPYHQQDPVESMAKKLGVDSKLQQRCNTCSYGERQRIAIIRALLQPFSFLLLDEPFSHLDEANRVKAMALIEEEATLRQASIILADLKELHIFKAKRKLHL